MADWMRVGLLYLVSLPVLQGTLARLGFVWHGAQGAPWVDQRYADHPLLTALHLLPGLLFLVLGPLQFSGALRHRAPRWHRNSGRVFMACGALSGLGVC